MTRTALTVGVEARPAPSAVVELLKPITWFPPMWAFGCGVVSSAFPLAGHWPVIIAGHRCSPGPLVCATSQAVNDWFDRHVDAINEPQPPDPVGPHARALGPLHRDRLDAAVAAVAARSGRGWFWRGGRRPRARLGLQRAADPTEAQRLVGQLRVRRLLRRASPGSPARP